MKKKSLLEKANEELAKIQADPNLVRRIHASVGDEIRSTQVVALAYALQEELDKINNRLDALECEGS